MCSGSQLSFDHPVVLLAQSSFRAGASCLKGDVPDRSPAVVPGTPVSLAAAGTVVWDSPEARPFLSPRGVEDSGPRAVLDSLPCHLFYGGSWTPQSHSVGYSHRCWPVRGCCVGEARQDGGWRQLSGAHGVHTCTPATRFLASVPLAGARRALDPCSLDLLGPWACRFWCSFVSCWPSLQTHTELQASTHTMLRFRVIQKSVLRKGGRCHLSLTSPWDTDVRGMCGAADCSWLCWSMAKQSCPPESMGGCGREEAFEFPRDS